METQSYDIIIVGAGLAGLSLAYQLDKKLKVAIVNKGSLINANSYLAQGGIASVIEAEDSLESHIEDTLKAGRGLCEPTQVKTLVTNGQQIIADLLAKGLPLDRKNGKPYATLEGGHAHRRVLHAGGGATGKILVTWMFEQVKNKPSVTFFNHSSLVDICTSDGIVQGVHLIHHQDKKNYLLQSSNVVLATGGYAGLYKRHSNQTTTTGEGLIIAMEAGAKLRDLEFIQFHPTVLSLKDHPPLLLSEALRGEGGYIIDNNGKRFLQELLKDGELAPRDQVSAAIWNYLEKHPHHKVYLDTRHLNITTLQSKFSTIYHMLKKVGLDMHQMPIPIIPAAHYTCGGVLTNRYGATNVKGLFACGEIASTGVMGGNRLASNSLLECLVFSHEIATQLHNLDNTQPLSIKLPSTIEIGNPSKYVSHGEILKEILHKYANVVRNKTGLSKGLIELQKLEEILPVEQSYQCKLLQRKIQLIKYVLSSALCRDESRGCHLREDAPDMNPQKYHTIVELGHLAPQKFYTNSDNITPK